MLELAIPIREFASLLLGWYRKNKRDLPWRQDPDPYHIWVSEVMLQQTQVKTVLPYFSNFLTAYPTLEALARAEESDVLSSWSGLGYYSRARNLHQAAQVVCERHGGEFPRDYRQAIDLPGIGPYTAGAILSIAYGKPLPILDGNIRRLLARYLKIETELEGAAARDLREFLSRLLKDRFVARNISDFNQALMEMGALVCTPRRPKCPTCPLSKSCIALREGLQQSLPRPRKRRAQREFDFTVALISRGKKYLLKRNSQDKFLRGFWEFPKIEGTPASRVEQLFQKVHGLNIKVTDWLAPVGHQITSRKLRFHPVVVSLHSPAPKNEFVWAKPDRKGYPVSSYVKKILRIAALAGSSHPQT